MRADRLTPGDWLVPLGVLAYGGLEAAFGILGPPREAAVMLTLFAVSSTALVVRRRHPIAALLIVAACWSAQPLLGLFPASMTVTAVFAVAIFACGRYAGRPIAFVAVPIGSALALLSVALNPDDTLAHEWPWGLFVLPVFALGAWFRQQRQQSEREATQRARTAAAEERVRIARELHDVLAHSVTLMVVQAEAAEELMDRDVATARGSVRTIQQVGRAALQDTRRLLTVLRAPDTSSPNAPLPGLDDLPALVTAMRSSGLPVTFRHHVDGAAVPAVAGRAAYRVVQEALTNTLRHAGAVPATVDVSAGQDRLVVDVRDGGSRRAAHHPGGHGLIGMRERVESCGGTFVARRTATGFHVRAEIPLEAR
jgi:signal transduction histidine kinase